MPRAPTSITDDGRGTTPSKSRVGHRRGSLVPADFGDGLRAVARGPSVAPSPCCSRPVSCCRRSVGEECVAVAVERTCLFFTRGIAEGVDGGPTMTCSKPRSSSIVASPHGAAHRRFEPVRRIDVADRPRSQDHREWSSCVEMVGTMRVVRRPRDTCRGPVFAERVDFNEAFARRDLPPHSTTTNWPHPTQRQRTPQRWNRQCGRLSTLCEILRRISTASGGVALSDRELAVSNSNRTRCPRGRRA